MTREHTPSAGELKQAEVLILELERLQDSIFAAEGPGVLHMCAVLAAAEIQGWLYVAHHADSMRRTLRQATESAAMRFAVDHKPVPACLA